MRARERAEVKPIQVRITLISASSSTKDDSAAAAAVSVSTTGISKYFQKLL